MSNIEEKCGQCHYFNSKDGICRNKQMQKESFQGDKDNILYVSREEQKCALFKAEMKDTRQLTPEILAAAGWKEVENTFFHIGFSKDIDDERFGRTEGFDAYMVVVFRKFPKSKTYHVQFDVARTLYDSFHTNFKRNITVGEFNTLLDIVKLEKFKING